MTKPKNGKNKDILRDRYERESGKTALTKAGHLRKDYVSFLKENCRPHWASVLSKFSKRVPKIEAGDIKPEEAMEKARKGTILEEKCSVGIGKTLSEKKSAYEKKYGLEF